MYCLEQIRPEIWPDYTRSVLGGFSPYPSASKSVAFGARLSGEPVGLVLAQPNQYDPNVAVVKLCAVAKRHRRAGVGSALLNGLEPVLAAEGYARGECWLMETSPARTAIERLLQRASWPDLQPHAYVCKSDHATLSQAKWVQIPFPDCLEKFHWSQLTEDDRTIIRNGRDRGWFPRPLDPLSIDPTSAATAAGSIGFRHQGRLAGWCVIYSPQPGKLSVVSLFADPALHRPAYAIAALAESIRLSPGLDYSWDVSFEREGMKRFVDRRMRPHLTSLTQALRSTKVLQQ
jgi:GNAT superfamily N-acetyltransferase